MCLVCDYSRQYLVLLIYLLPSRRELPKNLKMECKYFSPVSLSILCSSLFSYPSIHMSLLLALQVFTLKIHYYQHTFVVVKIQYFCYFKNVSLWWAYELQLQIENIQGSIFWPKFFPEPRNFSYDHFFRKKSARELFKYRSLTEKGFLMREARNFFRFCPLNCLK